MQIGLATPSCTHKAWCISLKIRASSGPAAAGGVVAEGAKELPLQRAFPTTLPKEVLIAMCTKRGVRSMRSISHDEPMLKPCRMFVHAMTKPYYMSLFMCDDVDPRYLRAS